MADLNLILDTATFAHFAELHRTLRAVQLRPYLSKTQGDEIAHSVDERFPFPVDLALAQRTPKGTVYIYIADKLAFTIDQRGAFAWPKVAATQKKPCKA